MSLFGSVDYFVRQRGMKDDSHIAENKWLIYGNVHPVNCHFFNSMCHESFTVWGSDPPPSACLLFTSTVAVPFFNVASAK